MVSLGHVEKVDSGAPLPRAVGTAFDRIRSEDVIRCALVFDVAWQPTMELVDIVVAELASTDSVRSVTLVHPSSAMAFIATAIGLKMPSVTVSARRSIYDEEPEDEDSDATASKVIFVMTQEEAMPAFIRRAVGEARLRFAKRFALVLDARSKPGLEFADLLAEELLGSTVKEIGLIHAAVSLDAVAAALRLRLPGIRVSCASKRA